MSTLPPDARQRLSSNLFTSDLTVDELVCLEDLGAEPLGLVMGSSIYHIGLQLASYTQNQELTVLTQAMHSARSLAISRMEKEAEMLEADGVAGVHFNVNRYEWGPELIEFVAVGTAIRTASDAGGPSLRPPHGRPFASDLSGQELWKLVRAGFRPVGLAMGNCVYHVAHQTLRQSLAKIGRNAEMENYTQATYDARELAMSRLAAEAGEDGAQGVVGVHVQESSWIWGGHIIEFFALGTGVIRSGERRSLTPQVVLGLGSA